MSRMAKIRVCRNEGGMREGRNAMGGERRNGQDDGGRKREDVPSWDRWDRW